MTARLFALLFVAAFYGAGYVPDQVRPVLGFILVAGVVAIVYGILHPTRR